MLRNHTEGKARKFTAGFAFSGHVDIIKHRKTLKCSFEREQITRAFLPSARVIVKLLGVYQETGPFVQWVISYKFVLCLQGQQQ